MGQTVIMKDYAPIMWKPKCFKSSKILRITMVTNVPPVRETIPVFKEMKALLKTELKPFCTDLIEALKKLDRRFWEIREGAKRGEMSFNKKVFLEPATFEKAYKLEIHRMEVKIRRAQAELKQLAHTVVEKRWKEAAAADERLKRYPMKSFIKIEGVSALVLGTTGFSLISSAASVAGKNAVKSPHAAALGGGSAMGVPQAAATVGMIAGCLSTAIEASEKASQVRAEVEAMLLEEDVLRRRMETWLHELADDAKEAAKKKAKSAATKEELKDNAHQVKSLLTQHKKKLSTIQPKLGRATAYYDQVEVAVKTMAMKIRKNREFATTTAAKKFLQRPDHILRQLQLVHVELKRLSESLTHGAKLQKETKTAVDDILHGKPGHIGKVTVASHALEKAKKHVQSIEREGHELTSLARAALAQSATLTA